MDTHTEATLEDSHLGGTNTAFPNASTPSGLASSAGEDPMLNIPALLGIVGLIVVTCAANILLITCVACVPRLRNITNVYFSSLAVADFLLGLTVMSFMAVFSLHGEWRLGYVTCTIWATLDFSLCTVSMFHLCLLSYERHYAIVYPLQHRVINRYRRTAILIAGAWVVGILAWAPAVVIFREKDKEKSADNECFFVPDTRYLIPQCIIVYGLPIVFMVYFYGKIVFTLHRRSAKATEQRVNTFQKKSEIFQISHGDDGPIGLNYVKKTEEETPLPSPVPNAPKEGETEGERQKTKQAYISRNPLEYGSTLKDVRIARDKNRQRAQQRRCTVTLGVIIATFLVCWLPFCFFWPVQALCGNCINDNVYSVSIWMAFCNSTINPLIYFIVNEDFRRGLKVLLRVGQSGNTSETSSACRD